MIWSKELWLWIASASIVSCVAHFEQDTNLLGTALQSSLYGSGNWTLTSAPYGLNWDSISSDSSGQYLVAAASLTGIFVSSDFGASWELTLNNTSVRWYPVSVSGTGQQIIVVGLNYGAFRSSDYGNSWGLLSQLETVEMTSLACNAEGAICVACQYGGSIYLTTDNGDTWGATGAPMTNWVALASNGAGTNFIAASNYDGIYVSPDSGTSWNLANGLQTNVDWVAVAIDQAGNNMAALLKGSRLYLSIDYGSTWTAASNIGDISSSATTSYIGMHMDSSGQQIVLISEVASEPVYITQNAGVTWSVLTYSASSQEWYGVTSDSSGQHLAAVSSHGGVYTYTLPVPTVCPAGKGRDGYICVPCGCESYNSGSSLYCKSCPNNAVSNFPYDECTRVCNYPFIVTVTNADTCTSTSSGDADYECAHLLLETPLWVLLLIITFTVVCLLGSLFTIHRQILVKLPSQSALRALKNDTLGHREDVSSQTSLSSNSGIGSGSGSLRSLASQSSKVFSAAYDFSFYLRLAFRSGVPALDMTTDALYILTSEFADTTVFVLCILAFLHPVVFMARDFWRLKDTPKAMPHFYVLPIPNAFWNLFENVDDFFKLLVFALLCLPFVVINAVTWFPMLILMFLLYSNKLFAFTMYSKTWYLFWNGSILSGEVIEDKINREISLDRSERASSVVECATHDNMPAVDVEFFNEQSLYCVLLQSIPQFCLQLYNVYVLNKVTPLALISLTTSMVAALNIFYRIVYYRILLKMDLKDVPNVLLELNQILSDSSDDRANQKKKEAASKKAKTPKKKRSRKAKIDEETGEQNENDATRNESDDSSEGEDSTEHESAHHPETFSPLTATMSITTDNNNHPDGQARSRGSFFETIRSTFGYSTASLPRQGPTQSIDMSVFSATNRNGDRVLVNQLRRLAKEEEEKQALLLEKVYERWQQQWAEEKQQLQGEILRNLRENPANINQQADVINITDHSVRPQQQQTTISEQVELEVTKQLQLHGLLPISANKSNST